MLGTLLGGVRCSEVRTGRKRRTAIEARAKSDGLQLLRAINETQAHGQEGARVDPSRAAHEAGLDVGDVGSDRDHHALGYLLEEAALLGDEHTAFDVGDQHPPRLRALLLHSEGAEAARGVKGSKKKRNVE